MRVCCCFRQRRIEAISIGDGQVKRKYADSLSLLGKPSLEEGNAVGRRVIFNLGGSFFGKNGDNMGDEETDHVSEVSD